MHLILRWRITIGFLITVSGILLAIWLLVDQDNELEKQAAENAKATKALCIIRADRAQSVKRTGELLDTFEGNEIFGIPRELIETSRDEDLAVVEALSILNCSSSDIR